MSHKIITISREFGSGGKYIGECVAEKLGIPYYDSVIMERIAEETGFSSRGICFSSASAEMLRALRATRFTSW